MSSTPERDADQAHHVRQRTVSSTLDSDTDQEVKDILRELAEHNVRQVAQDDMSDDEHTFQDQCVADEVASYWQDDPIIMIFHIFRVLADVVKHCPVMDQTFAKHTEPRLQDVVLGSGNVAVGKRFCELVVYAVQTKSFRHIRRLGESLCSP